MNHAQRFFTRLARLQAGHPWLVLLAVAVTLVPAVQGTLRLKLRTDFTELLPENKRSIQDLKRIRERMGSTSTYTVFLEGDDLAAMQSFADAFTYAANRLPRELVRWIEKDVREERAFVEANKYLYADTADLERVRDRLKERLANEKAKAALDLGLDDDPPPAATADDDLGIEEVRRKYDEKARNLDRFPGGYFVGEDNHTLLIFVKTTTSGGDVAENVRLDRAVKDLIAEIDPRRFDPAMRVSFTGDVLTAREEHDAVRDDLLMVTLLCTTLILTSIFLFYFEVRAILVLGGGVLVGVLWTFGFTWLHIGYLSTATAFLASIVPGNGINSGIILIARYLEERRRGQTSEASIAEAMAGTWAATLTASLAATLAYGALTLTGFRGFNQFGFIGGIGIPLCWLSNYLVVPTLLVMTQRERPRSLDRTRQSSYGRPFFFLAERRPLATVTVATALALGGAFWGYRWLAGDPFEYDFRNLRNEKSRLAGAGQLQERVNGILKERSRSGMVMLADHAGQVPLLSQALAHARTQAVSAGIRPPVGRVRTIEDIVPAGQEEKLKLLADIRALALDVLPRLSPEKRKEVEPWIPPDGLAAIQPADLPPALRRPFVEKDGRVGLVLYVEPPEGVSIWDGRGLLEFADAVRQIELPNGEVVHSSGQSVIFADMLGSILSDGPWLTLASFGAIVVLVVVTFRRPVHVGLVLFALLLGMFWMIGVTALSDSTRLAALVVTLDRWRLALQPWHLGFPIEFLARVLAPIKLNFLNFIAIPITFGIGVEYAVNVVRRYLQEGWDATREVLLETGGAVILCSMTTIWGYLSLLYSDNRALRSFGQLAVLGEITCLAAAVLVLPSLVGLIARRSTRVKPHASK